MGGAFAAHFTLAMSYLTSAPSKLVQRCLLWMQYIILVSFLWRLLLANSTIIGCEPLFSVWETYCRHRCNAWKSFLERCYERTNDFIISAQLAQSAVEDKAHSGYSYIIKRVYNMRLAMDLAWNLAPALTMLVFAARLTPPNKPSSAVLWCIVQPQ